MRRIQRLLIPVALLVAIQLVGPRISRAQQMYTFTNFMFNPYVINPAVVGTYNFYQIRMNSRFQWVGVQDAPITNGLTAYGPHERLPMGYGGMFCYDMTGPTSRAMLMGSYAYNFPLGSEMRISIGLSLGAMLYRMDGTKFDLGDNATPVEDPALLNFSNRNIFTPDGAVGVYLYASHFYVGLAAHQLFAQKLPIVKPPVAINRLMPEVYLSGGYLIYLTDRFELEPAMVIKYAHPYPLMVDFNLKITYQNMVWGGVSYRLRDAVSIMIGYKHQNHILVGYSFDFSYSSLWRHNAGTHELLLGYQFDKIK